MLEIVGHRAYRGKYTENTLEAYDNAYAANVDVIETDLQMTLDGVVVVNHDSDTGRMWDKELDIGESNFEEVEELRCKENTMLKMLTLVEVLEWCVAHPGSKLMLDIKFTNKKIILIKIFSDMLSVKNDIMFWQEHVIWGIWMLDWFKYGVETGIFRGFKVVVITLSLEIAKQFIHYSLELNNGHFRLYGISIHFVSSWTDDYLTNIVPLMKKQDIKVYLWTVNKVIDIKYACQLPSIHGVITDDPDQSRKITEELVRSSETVKTFHKPNWLSAEGLRYYSYIQVYHVVSSVLFNKWIHVKMFGWSIAYVIFLFLRFIKFL